MHQNFSTSWQKLQFNKDMDKPLAHHRYQQFIDVSIDIYRLLKFCYVLATSAYSSEGNFAAATNGTNHSQHFIFFITHDWVQ
jgi:hypothetical protein